jgi:DNA-binding winged helix-turn-helix (wHTH) protein/TolB-like protein
MDALIAKSVKFAEFELDGPKRLLRKQGQAVALNSKTFDLLAALIERHGEVVSKDELLEKVWPGQFVEEGNLTVQISTLRKVFGEKKDEHRFIVTVPGKGYGFVAELKKELAPDVLIESPNVKSLVQKEVLEDGSVSPASDRYAAARVVRMPDRWVAALSVLIIAAAGFGAWLYNQRSTTATPIRSIAVMPFVNESGNSEIEYLSDGMTESLINSLSKVANLSVKARSSVFHFKGKNDTPQQIGADLNVEAVLSGRILQRAELLTLYLSLVDARTGNQIWGEQYHRKLSDLVALQSEITHDVSSKLVAKVSVVDGEIVEKIYTTNPEAYQLYLKGRFFWNKRKVKDTQKAIEFFGQAIALDPSYALGYAGLADGYVLLSNLGGASPREMVPKAREAALKALALDNNLAAAHTSLGRILNDFDWDFAGAEREYKRAIELNPNDTMARQYYGRLLSCLGRREESLEEFRAALDVDPLSLSVNWFSGINLYYARSYDEAITQLEKTLELDTNFPGATGTLGDVYYSKGEYAAAVEQQAKVRELLGEQQNADLIRASFASGGRDGYLRLMTSQNSPLKPGLYYLARAHADLGEKDKAFAVLNKAYDNRDFSLTALKGDPRLDPLRDDPRFNDLVNRVGF